MVCLDRVLTVGERLQPITRDSRLLFDSESESLGKLEDCCKLESQADWHALNAFHRIAGLVRLLDDMPISLRKNICKRHLRNISLREPYSIMHFILHRCFIYLRIGTIYCPFQRLQSVIWVCRTLQMDRAYFIYSWWRIIGCATGRLPWGCFFPPKDCPSTRRSSRTAKHWLWTVANNSPSIRFWELLELSPKFSQKDSGRKSDKLLRWYR